MYSKNSSDTELIKGLLENNSIATKVLLSRYRGLIFKTSLEFFHDYNRCKDIESEIWEKVIIMLRNGKYTDQNLFAGWLNRLVKNFCIDLKRSDTRHQRNFSTVYAFDTENEFNVLNVVPSNEDLPDKLIMDKESLKNILSLISRIPKEQQEVVYMRIFEEMSFEEIADFQEIKLNTALARMRYGLINLRKIITSGQIV